MYPVYALYHYYPEEFRIRFSLALGLLFAAFWVALLLYKNGKISRHTLGWALALWVYTLFVLYMTVFGRYSFDDYRSRIELFASYREYMATGSASELRGIIGNYLLLIPFSFLTAELCRSRKPVLKALGASALMTLSIESLQYLTHTGTFELDDLIHNFAGAVIGVLLWLAFHLLGRFRLKRHTSNR